jgi:PAS domain S-box-containing protein
LIGVLTLAGSNHPREEGRAYAEALVDESADALIAVSLEGSILHWSRGASATFGYEPEEAIGGQLHDLVAEGPDREELRARFSRVRATGHQSFEATRRRKDGRAIRTDVSARLVRNSAARPPFVAWRERDITPAEERRRERRDVEQDRSGLDSNRLKSEFIANMSHELRSPLNTIIGFADLMHRGRVGPLSDTHREYLGDILDSSRRLLKLINDVLDLAKVESGKMAFRPELTDVGKTVTEVRDILGGLAANNPSKLKEVLYNYLSNALKFTPENGRVTIRALVEGDRQLRLEVEDTGIGISPDDVARLFVEFQQLDAGTSERYAGCGLGLALTKRIVEAQGGCVAVKSEPGRGSLFSCILPLPSDEPSDLGET